MEECLSLKVEAGLIGRAGDRMWFFNGNTTSPTSPTNIMVDNTFDTQNEEGDVFKAKSYDSIHDLLQSFDVNDGPDFFNTQPPPHPPTTNVRYLSKTIIRNYKRCLFEIDSDDNGDAYDRGGSEEVADDDDDYEEYNII
ncbi:hypothetical protein ACI65C_011368 [Semiaphis heraclei]